jgi:hypothetical protein
MPFFLIGGVLLYYGKQDKGTFKFKMSPRVDREALKWCMKFPEFFLFVFIDAA